MIRDFDSSELSAWIDEQVNDLPPGGYILQSDETTAKKYAAAAQITTGGAAKRLEKLVAAGLMTRRFEVIESTRQVVYKIEVTK